MFKFANQARRILGMGIENRVLVLVSGNDPQLAMLTDLPHTVCGEAATCVPAAQDATVILQWSGTRELLREVFSICRKVRWVHSRAAGLDNLLFPELVESPVLLTNGRGVFSSSLGEFVLAAILYFAKDFRRMVRNQTAGVWESFDVEEISRADSGNFGLWRHWPSCSEARACNEHARARDEASCFRIDRSASRAVLQTGGAARHDRALRLRCGDGSIDRGDATHGQRC